MMYTEKHNIIDLVPATYEAFITGSFSAFGFAVGDYLSYMGFTQDNSIDDIRSALKDEFLIAASMTNDTTLDDVKNWLESNNGYSVAVLDFHNVASATEKNTLLNLIESVLDEHLYDLCSYDTRFAFCKKLDA